MHKIKFLFAFVELLIIAFGTQWNYKNIKEIESSTQKQTETIT